MRRLPVAAAVAALAAVLLAVPAGARAAGQAPPDPVKQPVAIGSGGAVASMDVDASQAGIDVLKHGGNAVDAAVATASALGVTVPFVAGPGGGGFMVIYLAKTHEVVTIDGRENCPAACTTTMFLDPKTGQPLDYDYASDQPLATGVPSMVAAWAKAVSHYGARAWPPISSQPSGWLSAGSGSTRTSSSSPSPTCRNCRPTRPAARCC
jgi:gamma-glutamyltranspeptidase/glutathione hydrolase